MVKVLAMMKMPTKSEMKAKTSSMVRMLSVPLVIIACSSAFSLAPVSTSNWWPDGTLGWTWASSASSEEPGLAVSTTLL